MSKNKYDTSKGFNFWDLIKWNAAQNADNLSEIYNRWQKGTLPQITFPGSTPSIDWDTGTVIKRPGPNPGFGGSKRRIVDLVPDNPMTGGQNNLTQTMRPGPNFNPFTGIGYKQRHNGKRHRRGKYRFRRFKSINALYKAMFPSVRGQFQTSGQFGGPRNEKYVVQCATSFAPLDRLKLYVQQIQNSALASLGINTETIFDFINGKFLLNNSGDSPIDLKMWEFTFRNQESMADGIQTLITAGIADTTYAPADDAIAADLSKKPDMATLDYTDGTGNVHKGYTMGVLTSWERFPIIKEGISKRLIFKGRLDANDELTVKIGSKDLTISNAQLLHNDAVTHAKTNLPVKFFLFELQGIITHAATNDTKVGLTPPCIDYIYTESYGGAARPEHSARIYANTATQVFSMDDDGVVRTNLQSEAHNTRH